MKRIKKVLKKPELILLKLMEYKPFRVLPDDIFLKLEFFLKMRKRLNLTNPQTFNEKLQWLKLYDRNPKYTQLVDKYEVRKYIKNKIGEKYLIPLYGVYEKYEEIDFNELPDQFVLKPNHTSGDYFICKDKTKINHERLKKEVNMWLEREYYWVHREWPYKNVKPKIIAEKYMVDESGLGLNDYKFYCFNGEPKSLLIATERNENVKFDTFDIEFNHLPVGLRNSNKEIRKPKNFDTMIKMVRELSKDIPHVRIDLYNIDNHIYFGEYTFFSDSGYEKFHPNHEKYTRIYGDWLKLK